MATRLNDRFSLVGTRPSALRPKANVQEPIGGLYEADSSLGRLHIVSSHVVCFGFADGQTIGTDAR